MNIQIHLSKDSLNLFPSSLRQKVKEYFSILLFVGWNSRRVTLGIVFIFLTYLVLSGTVFAKSIFDIEFPVAELGNCKDKSSCKAYCAVEKNQEACENFAAEYGIANAKEKKQEREARKEFVMKDGGPGNCAENATDPEASCRAFCDVGDHMKECITYGKEHGLMKGKDLEEAEKVMKALDSGVPLPAGCTNERSCKETCEEPKDVETARSCFAFAEKAGLLPDGVDREHAEKVFKLIEEGKSPFKSPKDFRKCDNPESDEIMQKCMDFAIENGLMSPKDAEMVKKTGGKGPGNCRGKKQCDLYCNEHQDECMEFAEKHDLIRPEEKARMQEGMTRLKESIAGSPPEVKQCLIDTLGQEKLDKIISGAGFIERDLGEKMHTCFEKAFNGEREDESRGIMRGNEEEDLRERIPFNGTSSINRGREMPKGEQNEKRPQGMQFSPQVMECLKGKISEDTLRNIGTTSIRPDEALGKTISDCYRSTLGPQSNRESGTTPGGCRNEEECSKFCADPANADACKKEFSEKGGPSSGWEEKGTPNERSQPREMGRPEQIDKERNFTPPKFKPEEKNNFSEQRLPIERRLPPRGMELPNQMEDRQNFVPQQFKPEQNDGRNMINKEPTFQGGPRMMEEGQRPRQPENIMPPQSQESRAMPPRDGETPPPNDTSFPVVQ